MPIVHPPMVISTWKYIFLLLNSLLKNTKTHNANCTRPAPRHVFGRKLNPFLLQCQFEQRLPSRIQSCLAILHPDGRFLDIQDNSEVTSGLWYSPTPWYKHDCFYDFRPNRGLYRRGRCVTRSQCAAICMWRSELRNSITFCGGLLGKAELGGIFLISIAYQTISFS